MQNNAANDSNPNPKPKPNSNPHKVSAASILHITFHILHIPTPPQILPHSHSDTINNSDYYSYFIRQRALL